MLHGVPVTDPYRWLEDQNSPRTRKWLEEQTEYTRAYLDSIPGRKRIKQRVEELLAVETISEPWKVGHRYFFLKRTAFQEQPSIMMRDGEVRDDIVLVDPAARGEGSRVAVSIINISGNGTVLAYGIRQSGRDSQCVEFLDVPRRQKLPDRLGDGLETAIVFSPDGRGFYYSHEATDCSRPFYRAAYWHEFGSQPGDDNEFFFAGDDSTIHLGIFGSSTGRYLAYLVMRSTDPQRYDFYVQDLYGRGTARRLLHHIPPVFAPFFVKDALFAITSAKAGNFRIVAISLERPEQEHWEDVVPESPFRIKDFSVFGSSVCVGYTENLHSRIETFDLTGRRRNPVPCPPRGTARLHRRPVESNTAFYTFSSPEKPPTIFSYDGEQKEWATSSITLNSCSLETKDIRYKSKDGTSVSMCLIVQKGRPHCGPTLLVGYGGFGVCLTLQFNVYSTFLLERGILLALASVRGGGECGQEWHRAGKRHKRQNAFDDFIAAAEWLIEEGYTTPAQLGIAGGSNGGLLVSAALTQRPDLFRAVLCLGPLLDMLRYHRFDNASLFVDEYGTAEREDDFRYLYTYSPYHQIQQHVPYPAVMLVSGDADTRCNPMHARKMAARLQSVTSSMRPVLLDYKAHWGHSPQQPLTGRIEGLTDRLGFICRELGVCT
jgi:prolyl oligopeptidase